MSGNSQQRRQARRQEQRIAESVLKRIATKYKYDIGTLLLGIGLTITAVESWGALYWPGVVCVYGGVFLSWQHLCGEREIFSDRMPWARKLVASAIAASFLFTWTTKVVAVPTPLESSADATVGNYPIGTVLGGIPWDSMMDEDGRLHLANRTDNSYKDLDLLILSDLWIVDAAKLSGIGDVKITHYDPAKLQIRGMWLQGTDEKGNAVMIPGPDQPLDLAHPTGIRIVADALQPRSDLEILLVMVAFNQSHGLKFPEKMFSQKRMPTFVRLDGTYRVLGRMRDIHSIIKIEGQRQ